MAGLILAWLAKHHRGLLRPVAVRGATMCMVFSGGLE